jgi:Tol biopolymer transport system component/predicted Ser/Thr protein kinase
VSGQDLIRRALSIAEAMLDLDAKRRSAALEKACAGESELRAEVESILAAESRVEAFLHTPIGAQCSPASSDVVVGEPSSLPPGCRVGEFIVEERLGSGGMGVVYRARQTTLDRCVALKVLSPPLASIPSTRARFRREARAAARLRDDRIVAVYTEGEDGGVCFYAMELVQGLSLDRVLEQGVPFDHRTVARWAADIAAALDYAHCHGVIHRDVKPSNLILGDEGRIRITDFGLARLREEPAITQTGQLLGTPLYMSPEQLTAGVEIDGRSDVYSLGATLYQLLTLRPPFAGDSAPQIAARVLNEDPVPPRRIDRRIPVDLETICLKALAKTPGARYARAGELAEDLGRFLDGLPIRARRIGVLGWAARFLIRHLAAAAAVTAAALVALAAGALLWKRAPAHQSHSLADARPLTFDAGLTTECAISDDGRRVVYASDRSGRGDLDIYLEQVDVGAAPAEAVRLTSDPANEREPSLSSDGCRVVFRSERDGGGIDVVPAEGGSLPRRVAPRGREPRFSPDGGRVVYWTGDLYRGGRTYVVDVDGGAPAVVFPEALWTRSAVWAPDGSRLLVFAQARGDSPSDWWVVPLDGGSPMATGVSSAFPALQKRSENHTRFSRWLDDGRVWFWSMNLTEVRTELWAVPIADRTGEITGEPVRTLLAPGWFVHPSVSDGGRLVFIRAEPSLDLWGVALDAERGVIKAGNRPEPLTTHPAIEHRLSLAADGTRVAFGRVSFSGEEVWTKELPGGAERRIAARGTFPALSRDGTKVAYVCTDDGSLWVQDLAGGAARRIGARRVPRSWSPDGRGLLVTSDGGVGLIALDGDEAGKETAVLRGAAHGLFDPRFGPAGGAILFSAEMDRAVSQVFVAPYRFGETTPPDRWIAVTDGKSWDDRPAWSPDGRLVYFASNRDGFFCIWAQRLDAGSLRPDPEGPFEVLPLHDARFEFESYGGCWAFGVAADRLVLTPLFARGNVWLTPGSGAERLASSGGG